MFGLVFITFSSTLSVTITSVACALILGVLANLISKPAVNKERAEKLAQADKVEVE